MKLHSIAWTLLIIGGLNWLLIGLFNWGVADLVGPDIARIIYIIVGVATVYELVTCKSKKKWSSNSSQPQM